MTWAGLSISESDDLLGFSHVFTVSWVHTERCQKQSEVSCSSEGHSSHPSSHSHHVTEQTSCQTESWVQSPELRSDWTAQGWGGDKRAHVQKWKLRNTEEMIICRIHTFVYPWSVYKSLLCYFYTACVNPALDLDFLLHTLIYHKLLFFSMQVTDST